MSAELAFTVPLTARLSATFCLSVISLLMGAQTVKASAYNGGDPSSNPGSGRSPGEGNGTHSSPLAWKIPWTEEPGRLQSMGLKESDSTSLSLSDLFY